MSYFTLASTDLPACWQTGSMPEDSVSAVANSLRAAFLCFFHLSRLYSARGAGGRCAPGQARYDRQGNCCSSGCPKKDKEMQHDSRITDLTAVLACLTTAQARTMHSLGTGR